MSYMNFTDFTTTSGLNTGYGNYTGYGVTNTTTTGANAGTNYDQYALMFDKMDGQIDGKYNGKELSSFAYFAGYDYTQYNGSTSDTSGTSELSDENATPNLSEAEQKLKSYIDANVYLAVEGSQIKFDNTQTVDNVQSTLAAIHDEIKASGGNMLEVDNKTFYSLVEDETVYITEEEAARGVKNAEEAKADTAEQEAVELLNTYINADDNYTISGTTITYKSSESKATAVAELAALDENIQAAGELLKIGKTLYTLKKAAFVASNGVEMDAAKAAEILLDNFRRLDADTNAGWAWNPFKTKKVEWDGIASEGTMQAVHRSTDDENLKAAIEWFNANGQAFDDMKTMTSPGEEPTGHFTKKDLQAFLAKAKSGELEY